MNDMVEDSVELRKGCYLSYVCGLEIARDPQLQHELFFFDMISSWKIWSDAPMRVIERS